MKNIYKIFLLLIIILLTSCGSDDSKVEEETSDKQEIIKKAKNKLRPYNGKDFSMNIPKVWHVVTNNKEIITQPKYGKIELAVTSTSITNGFSNNIIILSQKLDKYTTSGNYSIINNVGAKDEYLNYYEISNRKFEFNDGEKSKMYIFKAKYALNTKLLQFLQTAHVCDNKAFLITLAIPTSVKKTEKYENMLSSFKCK